MRLYLGQMNRDASTGFRFEIGGPPDGLWKRVRQSYDQLWPSIFDPALVDPSQEQEDEFRITRTLLSVPDKIAVQVDWCDLWAQLTDVIEGFEVERKQSP